MLLTGLGEHEHTKSALSKSCCTVYLLLYYTLAVQYKTCSTIFSWHQELYIKVLTLLLVEAMVVHRAADVKTCLRNESDIRKNKLARRMLSAWKLCKAPSGTAECEAEGCGSDVLNSWNLELAPFQYIRDAYTKLLFYRQCESASPLSFATLLPNYSSS